MNKKLIKPEITKGVIVHYQDGWFRVSARFSWTVNLCGVFSGVITHKKVSILEVDEDGENWFKAWQKSETYQCM